MRKRKYKTYAQSPKRVLSLLRILRFLYLYLLLTLAQHISIVADSAAFHI